MIIKDHTWLDCHQHFLSAIRLTPIFLWNKLLLIKKCLAVFNQILSKKYSSFPELCSSLSMVSVFWRWLYIHTVSYIHLVAKAFRPSDKFPILLNSKYIHFIHLKFVFKTHMLKISTFKGKTCYVPANILKIKIGLHRRISMARMNALDMFTVL